MGRRENPRVREGPARDAVALRVLLFVLRGRGTPIKEEEEEWGGGDEVEDEVEEEDDEVRTNERLAGGSMVRKSSSARRSVPSPPSRHE
jgi:hypothetical protein